MPPRATTKIVLVRHGETKWNVEQRIQGQGDSPLTETGIEQARLIGRRLGREHFDRLVSSDLGRAMQTAAEIGQLTGHAVDADPRLRERHFGAGEGLGYAE